VIWIVGVYRNSVIAVSGSGARRLVSDYILAANRRRDLARNGVDLLNVVRKICSAPCVLADSLKGTNDGSGALGRIQKRNQVYHGTVLPLLQKLAAIRSRREA